MKAGRSQHVLWVEGHSDKRFFQAVWRNMGQRESGLEVLCPKDMASHGGKSAAQKHFAMWLAEAAEPKRYSSIGLCVDADWPPEGGFQKTDEELKKLLSLAGFRLIDATSRLYRHQSSGCLASYWIAPSHGDEGYIEALVLESLTDAEAAYLNEHIAPFVQNIPARRFKATNEARAKVYTYLAVQQKPDKSLPTLLDDRLIERSKQNFSKLESWLKSLFGAGQ